MSDLSAKDDSWKGEHLIRTRPSHHFNPGGALGKTGHKPHARTCAVPSCENVLYSKNISNVCRHHNHAYPFCRCPECLRGAGAQR